MGSEFVQRRWLEFRIGFSTYLVFIFTFANFMLILYGLTDWFDDIPFTYFGILLVVIITPSAIVIGNLHNRKQLPVEGKVTSIHHAYRDVIVPESKETLGNRFQVFSSDHAIWGLRNAKWNMELAKLNMVMMNFLLDNFNAPKDLRYKKQFEELDGWINDVEKWLKDYKEWKDRFQKYGEGKDASKL